jgi:transposase
MAAFEAIGGGVPKEILYDRMKTAVIGQAGGSLVYNRALIDFARHYRRCGSRSPSTYLIIRF